MAKDRITRIYRVRIHPKLRDEFEPLFASVARASVAGAPGCMQVTIGWPVPQTPDDYAMISEWDSAENLTRFIGPDWSQAHIPDGMAHFVADCAVQHFQHPAHA
ncbi:hypothetical protein ROE7235_01706 [Roseibaca ekhonensis]|uniref:ABM domain-containing protein n=1 Tax=Roseinatronobacter ekhonensis TaxID=254356 RepID=A0A3B0M7I8_9RHOB|nr:antibiotic biosynthesis monooxygenase [Roseibaca ekhonensis]SUZ31955.1 hypothetical protein ROE7235_01706 [Roseibaca ekhonensis]